MDKEKEERQLKCNDEMMQLAEYTWQNLQDSMIEDLNPTQFDPLDFDKDKFLVYFILCLRKCKVEK